MFRISVDAVSERSILRVMRSLQIKIWLYVIRKVLQLLLVFMKSFRPASEMLFIFCPLHEATFLLWCVLRAYRYVKVVAVDTAESIWWNTQALSLQNLKRSGPVWRNGGKKERGGRRRSCEIEKRWCEDVDREARYNIEKQLSLTKLKLQGSQKGSVKACIRMTSQGNCALVLLYRQPKR